MTDQLETLTIKHCDTCQQEIIHLNDYCSYCQPFSYGVVVEHLQQSQTKQEFQEHLTQEKILTSPTNNLN